MKINTSNVRYMVEEERITAILQQWGYVKSYLIGQGAFSRVYRVKESATGAFYACKVSTKWDMLQREYRLLQQISHPLFPAVLEFRQQGEFGFLFMEYVAGMSLEAFLAKRGRLSERQAIRISTELAGGLCYLHEQSTPILFRDMKPENIMIREDGKVKLLDFGSAGTMDTSARIITGTPGYAAPEQWKEQDKVGFHSDIYALGKVMYYMLTGRKPAISHNGMDIWGASDKKIHRGIKRLTEECMRAEIAERIPNVRSFLHRLKPYDTGQKGKIVCLEVGELLRGKKHAEYIYQQNVLKIFNENFCKEEIML